MWAIIKKEVKTYFLSPLGYVFIGAFMLMTSVFFYIFSYSIGSLDFASLFFYIAELLTFTIALLTMGMFAGERKNGTEIILFTSSRSITSIVIGKFIAALIVVAITEILSLLYYIIICCFAGGLTNVSETITVLIGIIILAMSYISFGGFISSLTDNQIIAGILTIILLLATWFLPSISPIFLMLSPTDLFESFTTGVIPVADTIGLFSQTLLFTLLTITVLQRKKNLK